MTVLEAKKFGRKKTLKATSIVLAILIFLLLLGETRGDFANGILFFLQALLNIHTIMLLLILFGLTFICAGRAGEEVVIDKQNIVLISLKYVILISLAITIYTLFAGVLRQNDFSSTGILNIVSEYALSMFLKTAFSLLIVWLWATNKMKSKQA